ncbi:Uma2 family endonuclease [Synechococcales cyanobacterium C]|uniref:Uma2 family endonuclease n=1 Tax=Petrachloros mirabilis ULC683 TaxID=2781853 RepID=A0A8K2A238_9CYAN|nr:Uma2 family endonuclease [Petrachloros mirabilis]NCJ08132.1 Uma2 family endonuclease [Petrachloros mirabilis ULC683]
MVQTQPRLLTPEEYLEWEAKADYKSEYRNGEIVPMTGGTTNHNELALNLAATLKLSLKSQGYKVYMGDVRLWIPEYRQYTYPDVMVIHRRPAYADDSKTTVMNPILIAEVLSKSTQNYDQGDKFMYYRAIPILHEYVLVDQKQHHVIQYTKTKTGQWLLTEYQGEDANLVFQSLPFTMRLVDLYEGIDFENSEQ